MRILLLEDDEQDYFLIKTAFKRFKSPINYELQWVDTIEEALELVKNSHFDLYLLDYSLKSGSGLEFIEKIQTQSIQNTPFIFITGYDSEELFEQSLNYKIFDYILKDDLNPRLLERAIIFAQDRKQKEEALIEQQQEDALKAKMESLGHLAGGMAHELNNLLHPVLLQTEMLDKDKLKQETQIDLHSYFDVIDRNLNKASKIIDSMMTFASIETDTMSATQTDLVTLLNYVIESYKVKTNPDLVIYFETEIDNINVTIDALIFQQILHELLDNAAHAMAMRGEIIIKLTLNSNKCVTIWVIDQGKGLEKEHIPHIFNPFFTTRNIGDGKGLGLSAVYRIVAEWGGHIRLENNIDMGVTAYLTLPIF